MDLHDIREDYCKQALSQHDCDPNPIKQFEKWLNEAITAKVNEPTGVNVATVNEDVRAVAERSHGRAGARTDRDEYRHGR